MLQLKKLSMDFIFSEGIVNYTTTRDGGNVTPLENGSL